MTDIELVIKIPKGMYEALRKSYVIISGQRSGKTLMSIIYNAISKGTPLDNVFDKIKSDIEQRPYGIANDSVIQGMKYERTDILEIINKYKSERSDKEWNTKRIIGLENECIDKWDICGKEAEAWFVKGKLQIRHRGVIHNIPSIISQEPKTGYWIYLKHNKARCSECHDVVLIAQKYGNANYCPNCGIKMKGKKWVNFANDLIPIMDDVEKEE